MSWFLSFFICRLQWLAVCVRYHRREMERILPCNGISPTPTRLQHDVNASFLGCLDALECCGHMDIWSELFRYDPEKTKFHILSRTHTIYIICYHMFIVRSIEQHQFSTPTVFEKKSYRSNCFQKSNDVKFEQVYKKSLKMTPFWSLSDPKDKHKDLFLDWLRSL